MKKKKLTGGVNASMRSMAKYSDGQIREIRAMWDSDEFHADEIAAVFGGGVENIRRIGRRDSYKWVKEMEILEAEQNDSFDRLMKRQEAMHARGGMIVEDGLTALARINEAIAREQSVDQDVPDMFANVPSTHEEYTPAKTLEGGKI